MPVEFEFKLIAEFVKRLTGDAAVCKLETIVAAAAAAAADTAEALLFVDGGRDDGFGPSVETIVFKPKLPLLAEVGFIRSN